jgi:hypothetical protein
MIAFDIFLNRKKLARAGVGSDGVLTAIASWVRRRAPERPGKRPQWDRDLSFSIGGYKSTNGDVGEHLKWEDRKLKPGDVLTIKVITTDHVDEPRRRVANDPELEERSQRRVYQRLKRKFEKSKNE